MHYYVKFKAIYTPKFLWGWEFIIDPMEFDFMPHFVGGDEVEVKLFIGKVVGRNFDPNQSFEFVDEFESMIHQEAISILTEFPFPVSKYENTNKNEQMETQE